MLGRLDSFSWKEAIFVGFFIGAQLKGGLALAESFAVPFSKV